MVEKDRALWQYVYLRKGYKWHWLPVDGSSSLKEMIVGVSKTPRCLRRLKADLIRQPDDDAPAIINSNNPLGFATMDIWEPHGTIPDLWRYCSRKGDVVSTPQNI